MQKAQLYRFIFPALFLITLLFDAYAGGFTQLPRNFGPFEIGMTQNQFTQLTSVSPESCAICIANESFATLDAMQMEQFDLSADGGDFFFYNNKLYHIAIGPKDKDLFIAQQEYEDRFGGAGKPIKNHGIGVLKWEDVGTVITLNYHEQEQEVYSVNIYDWNIKEERDWRESIAMEQPATAVLD